MADWLSEFEVKNSGLGEHPEAKSISNEKQFDFIEYRGEYCSIFEYAQKINARLVFSISECCLPIGKIEF